MVGKIDESRVVTGKGQLDVGPGWFGPRGGRETRGVRCRSSPVAKESGSARDRATVARRCSGREDSDSESQFGTGFRCPSPGLTLVLGFSTETRVHCP